METRLEGRKLVIEINLDEEEGVTGNGNVMIASTRGWLKIEKKVSLNLNLIRSTK